MSEPKKGCHTIQPCDSLSSLSLRNIYKKRRGRSKYLLSVDVMIGKENPIPAKIVCVRNKANRKDWLAFICTNKTCKSTLNLIGDATVSLTMH